MVWSIEGTRSDRKEKVQTEARADETHVGGEMAKSSDQEQQQQRKNKDGDDSRVPDPHHEEGSLMEGADDERGLRGFTTSDVTDVGHLPTNLYQDIFHGERQSGGGGGMGAVDMFSPHRIHVENGGGGWADCHEGFEFSSGGGGLEMGGLEMMAREHQRSRFGKMHMNEVLLLPLLLLLPLFVLLSPLLLLLLSLHPPPLLLLTTPIPRIYTLYVSVCLVCRFRIILLCGELVGKSNA